MEKNNEEEHIFWDRGFRSNTPLREVLQAHRDYWLLKAKEREGDTKHRKKVTDKSDEIGNQEEEKNIIMKNMIMLCHISKYT
jgi:hypothetical protein